MERKLKRHLVHFGDKISGNTRSIKIALIMLTYQAPALYNSTPSVVTETPLKKSTDFFSFNPKIRLPLPFLPE